eukprot:scaffold73321_cov36-Tisochrysis_lutea.AAC.5
MASAAVRLRVCRLDHALTCRGSPPAAPRRPGSHRRPWRPEGTLRKSATTRRTRYRRGGAGTGKRGGLAEKREDKRQKLYAYSDAMVGLNLHVCTVAASSAPQLQTQRCSDAARSALSYVAVYRYRR